MKRTSSGSKFLKLCTTYCLLFVAILTSASATISVLLSSRALAACNPSPSYGTDTLTVTIPTTTTYYVWVRILSPDGINNQVMLSIDGGTCNTMGASMPANTWTWVDTTTSSSTPLSMSLTQGNHSFVFTGNQANVEIDELQLLSEPPGTGTGQCTPVGTQNNCLVNQSANPSVTIPLSANSYIHTKTAGISATATPNDGGSITSCGLYVNNVNVQTLNVSPYNFSVDTTQYMNGSQTVTARCSDDQSNVGIASVNLIVNNGDFTNAGSVGLSDLVILANNWGNPNATFSQGNIVGGPVGLSDLIILANNWGWKAP